MSIFVRSHVKLQLAGRFIQCSVRYSSSGSTAKVVIITGASSGIGEELGMLYAAKGSNVVLAARRVDKLEDVVKRCREKAPAGTEVISKACDVSNDVDCKALIETTVAKYGRIDTLILNAGIGQSFFFESTSPDMNVRQFMDINYYGCVYPTTHALQHLHKTAGRIVVVSSLGGLMPFPRQTFYNATKHALMGFFDTLRLEIVGKKTGVSITMVCPGFVKTEITAGGGLGRDGKPIGKSAGPGFKMITAKECAQAIVEGAESRKRIVITPKWYSVIIWMRKFFPEMVDSYLAKNFARNKPAK